MMTKMQKNKTKQDAKIPSQTEMNYVQTVMDSADNQSTSSQKTTP